MITYVVAPAVPISDAAQQMIQQLCAQGRILQVPSDYTAPVLEFIVDGQSPLVMASTLYTLGSLCLGSAMLTPIRNRAGECLLTIARGDFASDS